MLTDRVRVMHQKCFASEGTDQTLPTFQSKCNAVWLEMLLNPSIFSGSMKCLPGWQQSVCGMNSKLWSLIQSPHLRLSAQPAGVPRHGDRSPEHGGDGADVAPGRRLRGAAFPRYLPVLRPKHRTQQQPAPGARARGPVLCVGVCVCV